MRFLLILAAILTTSTASADFGMSVKDLVNQCVVRSPTQYPETTQGVDDYIVDMMASTSCFGFVAGVLASESGTFCSDRDIIKVTYQITDIIRRTPAAKPNDGALKWIRDVIHNHKDFQCTVRTSQLQSSL